MAKHADEPLPRLALLPAQRAAHIRQHQQLVRQSFLTEGATPHLPAPPGPRQLEIDHSWRVRGEARPEPQLRRAAAQRLLARPPEQRRARAVDEPQRLRAVEREHGDVDLFHHAPQQRRRLQRTEPLGAQILAETVQLEQEQAERVRRVRPAGAHREIPLPQRGEHVRDRLERADHVLAQGRGDREPGDHDDAGESPLRTRGEVAQPQEGQGEGESRHAREEREQQDATLVSQALAATIRSHAA